MPLRDEAEKMKPGRLVCDQEFLHFKHTSQVRSMKRGTSILQHMITRDHDIVVYEKDGDVVFSMARLVFDETCQFLEPINEVHSYVHNGYFAK